MRVGEKRTRIARAGAVLGFLCGVIGLAAGLLGYTWKLGPGGWFVGGVLLTMLALFVLVDGVVAFEKARIGADV